jgi:hypothetical protein
MSTTSGARVTVYTGGVLLTLAFLALPGAWVTRLTGGTLFGLGQQHLFNDATVLALLGIGMFLDALWHARRV